MTLQRNIILKCMKVEGSGNYVTHQSSCSQVRCQRSLSSKIFESSQAVMKETSSSLGVSWKVRAHSTGVLLFLSVLIGSTCASGGSEPGRKGRLRRGRFTLVQLQFRQLPQPQGQVLLQQTRAEVQLLHVSMHGCRHHPGCGAGPVGLGAAPHCWISLCLCSFRLHSRPPLSKEFEVSLKDLPSTYDHRNTSAFTRFLSVYGTHYIRRVGLGGRVNSITAIRTCQAAMSQMSVQMVSNCLSVEAKATIYGVTGSFESKFCRSKSKSLKTGATFKQAFSDRSTEVLGGDGDVGDILFNPNGVAGYKKWLASLKRVPGLVWYQISPLHLLVTWTHQDTC